jgi:MFS transporter, YNFM family, putative membrane transport protein
MAPDRCGGRRTPIFRSRRASIAMVKSTFDVALSQPRASHPFASALLRAVVICLTAFLTVVDLFATQAILPSLVKAYGVSPAVMGVAVNASTIGMAIAGLAVAFFSSRIDRRLGVLLSLALLSIPTTLLAVAPDLTTFTALRIVQGLFMSSAFTLTLAYLAEETSGEETAAAFAAYITGNVASNLFGRLMSASIADTLGLAANFYVFAVLNLAGALLVYFSLNRMTHMATKRSTRCSPLAVWAVHLRNAPLLATFGIGFCILFAFIGTFTYVNFVLVRPPLALGMMTLGLVYFVFLPSIFTTPLAGRLVQRFGTQPTLWGELAVAGAGLPLLLVPPLISVLIGMVLVGVGTFLAQATATSFVGRAATTDPGSASGIYLASYFSGGLVGSAVLGQLFVHCGWGACVAGIAISLALAALFALRLDIRPRCLLRQEPPELTSSEWPRQDAKLSARGLAMQTSVLSCAPPPADDSHPRGRVDAMALWTQ